MAADTCWRDGVLDRIHPRAFAGFDGDPGEILVRQGLACEAVVVELGE